LSELGEKKKAVNFDRLLLYRASLLDLGEGKASHPVPRGPGGRKAVWLLVILPFHWSNQVISSKARFLDGKDVLHSDTVTSNLTL
jgi:hypothetical protein